MHTQVMEGVCTAGTPEEQVPQERWRKVRLHGRFEHVRVSYTRKHTGILLRYTCMYYTHSESCVHTAVHTHTAVTMLSAQRISSAVYTPAFTRDRRDLYRSSAGGR